MGRGARGIARTLLSWARLRAEMCGWSRGRACFARSAPCCWCQGLGVASGPVSPGGLSEQQAWLHAKGGRLTGDSDVAAFTERRVLGPDAGVQARVPVQVTKNRPLGTCTAYPGLLEQGHGLRQGLGPPAFVPSFSGVSDLSPDAPGCLLSKRRGYGSRGGSCALDVLWSRGAEDLFSLHVTWAALLCLISRTLRP